jgi:co-chaperonin GroES (HSP10)
MAIKGTLRAIHDDIIIADMEFGEERTTSGLYIPSQNGKTEGIKPRWGKVYAIGPDQKDVNVGDWIYVEHARWTRGAEIEDENGIKSVVRKVDTKSVLLISDEMPNDINLPE